jgi:hypothetical protein
MAPTRPTLAFTTAPPTPVTLPNTVMFPLRCGVERDSGGLGVSVGGSGGGGAGLGGGSVGREGRW